MFEDDRADEKLSPGEEAFAAQYAPARPAADANAEAVRDLAVLESAFTPPSAWCPEPNLWLSSDADAPESEVIEFLYALIVLTKARIVVETGTYLGETAIALGYAVSLHRGHVHTAETDIRRYNEAAEAIQSVACSTPHLPVTLWNATGAYMIRALSDEGKRIDLAFLDSSIEARVDELQALYSRIKPGGVVVIHDAAPHHATMGYLGSLKGWNWLRFRTPRGLLVLQRTEDVEGVRL